MKRSFAKPGATLISPFPFPRSGFWKPSLACWEWVVLLRLHGKGTAEGLMHPARWQHEPSDGFLCATWLQRLGAIEVWARIRGLSPMAKIALMWLGFDARPKCFMAGMRGP
jgi:hypothetical protein